MTAPAHASTGINQQLSFQGKVVNTNGTNIPDGTYNMEFKIYQDGNSSGSGSTLKWTEDYLVGGSGGVTVTAGTFQVNLGSHNAFGNSVDWNQDTLWLSFQVGNTSSCTISTNFHTDCSGDGEMSPYIRLTAVPYAMNANKLNGLSSTDFAQLAVSNTFTAANTINTNSATALKVEQTGVNNNVLVVDTANGGGLVGVGMSPITTGTAAILQITGANTALRFGNSSADSGGYLVSGNASSAALAGGASLSGTTWTAKASTAVLSGGFGSYYGVYADGNLTVGSAYSPTLRFSIVTGGPTTFDVASNASAFALKNFGATVNYFNLDTTGSGTLSIAGAQPASVSSNGTAANTILSVSGPKGGNTSGTTGQTGGAGSSISLTAGDGGNAAAGSTNGSGGNITLNAGAAGSGGSGGSAGQVLVKNTGDSLTAFQVQTSTGKEILTVDTSGNQLVLGKTGAAGVVGKLVFNNGTDSSTAAIKSGATSSSYVLTLPTALPGSTQCLQSDNAGALSFTACGGSLSIGTIDSQTKSSNGAVYVSGALVLQTADGSNPGLVSTGAQTFAGAKKFTSGLTIETDSTGALTINDSGAHNSFVFDTTTNHLKLFENTTTPTNYLDLYYDDATSSGIIAASAGTTKVGSGSGPISILAGSGAAITITGNAASSYTTTSGGLTFTGAAASTWSTTAGNLTLQSGSGTVSFGSSTSLTANGALTLAPAAAAALTLTGHAASTWSTDSGALTLTSAAATTWSTTTGNLTLAAGGANKVIVKPGTDSSTAFQVQQSGGTAVLNVDTSNHYVGINNTSALQALDVNGNILIDGQPDSTPHTFGSTCGCLLNSAAGTFGSQTGVTGVVSSVVYRGKLFVAVKKTDGGVVYRYDGGTTWTPVTFGPGQAISTDSNAAGAAIDSYTLTTYQDKLFIGSQGTTATGAVYYSSDADTAAANAATWTLVNTTRGTFDNVTTSDTGVADMAVWNNDLYVFSQKANAAEVFRYNGGTGAAVFKLISFSTAGKFLTGDTADMDSGEFAVYGGRLWAGAVTGSTTGRVYSWDGQAWTLMQVTRGTFDTTSSEPDVTSMTVHQGSLYIATSKSNAANIYKYTGGESPGGAAVSPWLKLTSVAGEIDQAVDTVAHITSITLRSYNGRLYAGSNSTTNGEAAIYEYKPITESDNFAVVNTTRGTFGAQTAIDSVDNMIELNGSLYIGTEDAGGLGSVYSFSKTLGNSYALKFDSGGGNYASISFQDNQQAIDNNGHEGSFIFSNTITTATGAYDYAEDYPSLDTGLQAGDPVSVDPDHAGHVKRAAVGENVLGVVSEHPGFRLSSDTQPADGAQLEPIALVGRVPVKVTTHGGSQPIKAGDSLAVSSTPGVLEKAGPQSGAIVGAALAGYSDAVDGKIDLYVSPQLKPQSLDYTSLTDSQGLDVLADKLYALTAQRLEADYGLQKKIRPTDTTASDTTEATMLNNLDGNPATVALDLKVNGSLTVLNGLQVAGNAEFSGDTLFDSLVSFGADVDFKKDVSFTGQAVFNNDAGGAAVIHKGAQKVQISFTSPYSQTPVVNANYLFDDSKDADGNVTDSAEAKQQRLLAGGYSYAIIRLDKNGFAISLNKPAVEDINFNWAAIAVKDAKLSEGKSN